MKKEFLVPQNSSYQVNSYVSIQLTGTIYSIIAKVVSSDPLIIAAEDNGPCSRLYSGDFVLNEEATRVFQENNQREINTLLQTAIEIERPHISALASLGVPDMKYHVMQPHWLAS